MKKIKVVVIIIISLILSLTVLKGISQLVDHVIKSDESLDKIGQIELPNGHSFVKIHTKKIALNNESGTVTEGRIETVAWNDKFLLFEVYSKLETDNKEMKLYSFLDHSLVTIKGNDNTQIEASQLSREALRPISDFFYETKKGK